MTDIKLYKEWHKAKEEMFKMGEERGEKDVRPRDMLASTALKILGWRSNTPLKKVLSRFDIDFEYGEKSTKSVIEQHGLCWTGPVDNRPKRNLDPL